MTKEIRILYLCTILVLCTLYAAQPIQPLFMSSLKLSSFEAVVFTTVIMLPLGIAPILYGYILESASAKKMLLFSLICLGVLEIIFSLSNSYYVMLFLRALQGLVIPAALTSIISYISIKSSIEIIQKSIGNYVATTIIGGFVGRFLSGLSSEYFGWRPFFFLLGILLIVFAVVVSRMGKDIKLNYEKPTIKEIGKVLKIRHNTLIYISMFFVFFVFQAVLNFLPFELKSLGSGIGEGKIGFVYIGYAIGVIISLNATWIIKFFKSEKNAMIVGAVIYGIGITLFHITSFWIILFSMFVFCCGMFTIHSIATGYINRYTTEYKGIANGLYLSFYYAGGTLGTFLPSFIYDGYGWDVLLNILLCVVALSVFFLFILNSKK